MKDKRKIEIALTAVIFSTMMIATLIEPGSLSILSLTGNVVIDNTEDLRISIQKMLREDFFQKIPNNAKLCLQIRDKNNTVSFKIRKISNILNVDESHFYCDGKSNEDFVFTFTSYDYFLEFKNKLNVNFLMSTNDASKIEIWESKHMRSGGYMVCSEELQEKYCTPLASYLSNSELKKVGADCCIQPDMENPSFQNYLNKLKLFMIVYWWLFLLILICLLLGGGAIMIFSTKDEQKRIEPNKQISEYIDRMKKSGYSDDIIKKSLLEVGWNEKSVKDEFETLRKKSLTSLKERFKKI